MPNSNNNIAIDKTKKALQNVFQPFSTCRAGIQRKCFQLLSIELLRLVTTIRFNL